MDFKQFISENTWTKSEVSESHYVIDKNAAHSIRFDLFVAHIKTNGIKMRINDKSIPAYVDGDYYYWVVETSGRFKHTIIHRAYIISISEYVNPNAYDNLFQDEDSKMENAKLSEMIGQLEGSVLDVGCGTGLLLELKDIEDYTGIDASPLMVQKLIEKFPNRKHQVMICKAEILSKSGRKYDNVIALFSASYIQSPKAFFDLWNGKGKMFLMFYKEYYFPFTHERLSMFVPYKNRTMAELQVIFGEESVKAFNNYYIVQL
ncbi:class I SAM-dependent methyltransferase [Flavobacterium sedimenticola]|uniref:Class I SAM-dependent methyltransferase n=1 Tax=Flavobacterium sedimenticola TaxID=3043286 RepID=A0ABT6XMV3_9FLAO|nr:class I SAM-dependent methyltransferase [Flavobacterium sedimenticola]MDI9256338.1 class I SAM-dependent methyltransferase [Flavobacterium sedimenticola]